jgi:ABC-type transport system involved in multi-copper enzyme maturation permease subunit
MIRAYRAEFTKLLRHRVLLVSAAVALLFAIGAAAIVVNAAKPAAQYGPGESRALSIEALGDAGGGTQVFRGASAFAGVFVLVVFIAWTAVEFSRGTMRTMLLRQPRRLRLLAGKVAALLTFAACVLALTEVASWITARIVAPGSGIETSAWTSIGGLGAGLSDYGAVLLWVTGYALLGTALAVVFRSIPIALGVGIAWFGPFEHILQNNWSTASRVFPGLGLEAFVAGGTPDVTAGRALVVVVIYVVATTAIAATLFVRRDVTA